ncbi:MAG: M20 family metallopeptidase [Bacillota bacterium]
MQEQQVAERISNKVSEMIESKKDIFIKVSDQIWEFAETRFEEFKTSELLCKTLEQQGFTVDRGVGNMPTAFIGSFGKDGPIVAILGEFDALAELSQKKGVAGLDPVTPGGNGHGCGHNLLGSGSLAAAVAVKEFMEANNLPGTIRYYGCPGEEGGSGKTFMVREGLFADVDYALCWHPGTGNGVMNGSSLANYQVYFKFKGRSAHAAQSPHTGRSALDAVAMMNAGVNYLREHVIQDARLHYSITNTGGFSPNVVQSEAEVLYLVRAPKVSQVDEIYKRVCKIAEGAALMTETDLEIIFDKACSNLIPNNTIQKVLHEKFRELGTPKFNEEDLQFAKKIRATLSDEDKTFGLSKEMKNKDLADSVIPLDVTVNIAGSTDVGDVSWVVPTGQIHTACFAVGTTFHTYQIVAQGAMPLAHKGMLHAGKVMAAAALEILNSPELITLAKQELAGKTQDDPYRNPIPKDVAASARK